MIYFDRQMQRIQEAFEQLDTQVYFLFHFLLYQNKLTGIGILGRLNLHLLQTF